MEAVDVGFGGERRMVVWKEERCGYHDLKGGSWTRIEIFCEGV